MFGLPASFCFYLKRMLDNQINLNIELIYHKGGHYFGLTLYLFCFTVLKPLFVNPKYKSKMIAQEPRYKLMYISVPQRALKIWIDIRGHPKTTLKI